MSERAYTVAIVGATGVVGGTVRAILEERAFPVRELRLLASERSRGAQLTFNGAPCAVGELSASAFAGVDLAFFAAGGKVSQRVRAPGGRGGRRGDRQVERLSRRPRTCRWWCPRSMPTTWPATRA